MQTQNVVIVAVLWALFFLYVPAIIESQTDNVSNGDNTTGDDYDGIYIPDPGPGEWYSGDNPNESGIYV